MYSYIIYSLKNCFINLKLYCYRYIFLFYYDPFWYVSICWSTIHIESFILKTTYVSDTGEPLP